MKLEILEDIHKIDISGKYLLFTRYKILCLTRLISQIIFLFCFVNAIFAQENQSVEVAPKSCIPAPGLKY